jgi:hypothetical protein
MEEWKQYTHISNLWVSNIGNIKFICPIKKKDIHIKPIHYGKYQGIKIEGKNIISLHSLIAETFIPNPEYRSYVRHINGNTKDNRVENLEWAKRKSGKEGGRPRKNTDGITISTCTTETSIELSTNDDPVVIGDYRIEYIKSISKWSVFHIIDENTVEYKGVFKSKDEAEMAVPYQNEFY